MDEAEERFLRVTIGFLATHTRSLALAVSALSEAVQESAVGGTAALLQEMIEDLAEMDASLARIIKAFPPEMPGGSGINGGRLH